MTTARRLGLAAWRSPTLMTWVSLGVRLGGLTLLLPLVLTHLSTQEVLVWQMLSTIIGITVWIDFGFNPTFTRIIAFTRGGGTLAGLEAALPIEARVHVDSAIANMPVSMRAVMDTQRAVYRRLIVATLLFGSMVGTAVLIRPVGALSNPESGWAAWVATATAAIFMIANMANNSFIIGYERTADMRRIEALIGACQFLSTSAVVVLGGGLFAIVACYSAWVIVLFLLNQRLARIIRNREAVTEPGAKASEALQDAKLFPLIWPAVWRSGVGVVMGVGIIQGSGLIYAQFAAPKAAAAYLLALRLISALGPIAQAPFYTKLQTLAKLRAEKKIDELVPIATRGIRLSYWTYVAGALVIMFVGQPLLTAIKSSVPLPDQGTMILFLLAFFAERYSAMHMQLYSLTNHIVWHIANGVTGLLMTLVCLALWPILEASAMPMAMLVAYGGFCAWYTSHLSLPSIGVSRGKFERQTALWPALALALGLGSQIL